jgi:hypothetical protein
MQGRVLASKSAFPASCAVNNLDERVRYAATKAPSADTPVNSDFIRSFRTQNDYPKDRAASDRPSPISKDVQFLGAVTNNSPI